ncbi:SDR family oxidoreductase [Kitasatospora sp. NPDC101447]|uniref:SDR family oxidoreductase n=1 Tax=Kitasatospora sp. NPDC101447 TaxID=3364102 RepID=UPI003818C1D3
MTVLITGARGKIGRAVLGRLHAQGLPVRAASAEPAELTVPAGVATVELVLDRPQTFSAGLTGVRQVFLYPNPEGIDAFIGTARAAGVEHIVLLSSSSVLTPGAETDPLAAHNLRVERALAASGIPTTFLRADAFASNALGWSHPISHGLPVRLAYPDAHLAPVHPDDIADIAVEALTGTALKGRTLTLTGGQSLTFREQLAVLSEVLDRDVTVETITHAEAEQQMSRFMPARIAGSLLTLWAAACVGPAPIGETTRTLLGTPERSFHRWVTENAAAFTAR